MCEYDDINDLFIEREDDVYAPDIDDVEWDETLIPEVIFIDDETFSIEEEEFVDDVDWFRED
jgi:hypothetical protein